MNQPCSSTGVLPFGIGLTLGMGVGALLGMSCCSSRRSMKKMAQNTANTVAEAMDALRESLHHCL